MGFTTSSVVHAYCSGCSVISPLPELGGVGFKGSGFRVQGSGFRV
jgi:hypothetical protein